MRCGHGRMKKKLLIRATNRNERDDLGDYLFQSILPAATQLGIELVRVPYMEYYADALRCLEEDRVGLQNQINFHIKAGALKEVEFANKFSPEECLGFLFFTDWSLVGFNRAAFYYAGHNHPVIFWNREDPNHFGPFLSDAQYADVICTSAEECVVQYMASLPGKQVICTPMAVAPEIYNSDTSPERFWGREFDIVFVGNRYGDRTVRTSGDVRVLFAAIEWAREHGKKMGVFGLPTGPYSWHNIHPVWPDSDGQEPFLDPDECKEPNPDYHGVYQGRRTRRLEAADVYRNAKVALSVASNEDSITMVPNRVVQIAGTGTILIAHKSIATEHLLDGHVLISDSMGKTKQFLDDIFLDLGHYEAQEDYLKRMEMAKQHTLSNHTFKHRLISILQAVGRIRGIKKRVFF